MRRADYRVEKTVLRFISCKPRYHRPKHKHNRSCHGGNLGTSHAKPPPLAVIKNQKRLEGRLKVEF